LWLKINHKYFLNSPYGIADGVGVGVSVVVTVGVGVFVVVCVMVGVGVKSTAQHSASIFFNPIIVSFYIMV
jgi:uncharacterized protein (DUF2062 family)